MNIELTSGIACIQELHTEYGIIRDSFVIKSLIALAKKSGTFKNNKGNIPDEVLNQEQIQIILENAIY